MIQLNLLPDLKLEYIKTRQSKRTVMLASSLAAGSAVAVCLLLFLAINVFQKQHLRNLDRDIKRDSAALQATPDLDKILTVQNQLVSLPALHQQKPAASKLFGYLSQLTPAQVSIARLKIDFDQNNGAITGTADNLGTVNKFIDTLKFTDYLQKTGEQGKAFSSVVLSNFTPADKKTNFEIKFNFEPAIFDSAAQATLTVPPIITTRSATEKPGALFQQQPKPDNQVTP